MSDIEWTDKTWNPTTGCSRVSAGCDNCYAINVAHRAMQPAHEGLTKLRPKDAARPGLDWTGVVRCLPDRLSTPLRWRKPRRVFVNSMSDLFHPSVPFTFVAAVFGVMAATPRHTYQVLTKRPERALEFFEWASGGQNGLDERVLCVQAAMMDHVGMAHWPSPEGTDGPWPLPNVHLGVSAEDQATWDERVPLLLECPAAVRFVSCEPLLGPIDVSRCMWPVHWAWDSKYKTPEDALRAGALAEQRRQALVWAGRVFVDWVIVGGESGPGARPCGVEWIRGIVRQSQVARVPVFVKQLGAHPVATLDFIAWPVGTEWRAIPITTPRVLLRDRKGKDPSEWPEDLRVRQLPGDPR